MSHSIFQSTMRYSGMQILLLETKAVMSYEQFHF